MTRTTLRSAASSVVALGTLLLVAGCNDSGGSSQPSPSLPPLQSSATPIPTASTPVLTPLPSPTKPWPTPKVTGTPSPDAPLAQRIRFGIARGAQLAAGKAATTKVSCPGLDNADEPGRHQYTCTVTYAGKSYKGTLVVDAEDYTATYKFTSDWVPIVREKVIDAVRRTVRDAAKITCTMDAVAVVNHADREGIACDVTTTANAVQPYRSFVSGDGRVIVSRA